MQTVHSRTEKDEKYLHYTRPSDLGHWILAVGVCVVILILKIVGAL